MAQSNLAKEIHEQPDVLRSLLSDEHENVKQIIAALRGRFHYVVIAARGTSDNAARYAQYLFGAHNQLQVALATPSLFSLYNRPPNLSGALVIGISQSGQSPDIVSVIAEGRRQGCPTLAITNDINSRLAQAAEYIIPLHAAPEVAVAATKSYTASLAALALISCVLSGNEDHLRELEKMPAMIERTFEALQDRIQHVKRYCFMEHCAVIGRGYNYSTAFETALKIKELTSVAAESYSSADFRHGPIATVSQRFPVFLVTPRGAISNDIADLVARLKQLRADMLVVSDDQSLLRQANLALPIPEGIPEWLTPLAAIVPGQMFAMQLTIDKGMDTDNPEGLTKVTETR